VRYRFYLLILMSCLSIWLSAQSSPEVSLAPALALERAGQPQKARTVLERIIASRSPNDPVAGQALDILGLTYKDEGNFAASQRAFEESIRILENSPSHMREYGMALDNFGGLLFEMNQFEASDKTREKALSVYERAGDHAGIAIACSDLAGLALSHNSVRRAAKLLNRAQREAQLAIDLDDDNRAAISSMQGWLAMVKGNAGTSVASYEWSLDLWKKQHGDEHPSTGWGYVLVGNAKAKGGKSSAALDDIEKGLEILARTTGPRDARYLKAELVYARLLDGKGSHTEAARIKTDAERDLHDLRRSQCMECTLSVAAFR
jgi:tetratricopeptide (TPR) repeat protein